MPRNILALFLSLSIGFAAAAARPPVSLARMRPAGAYRHFLPLVQYIPGQPNPQPIEVVKTAQGEIEGYPTVYYAYGYVRNLTTEPFYDVVIDMEVTICPYDDPPPPCAAEVVQLTPALTATLPNQVNPFSYRLYLGKASASIGPIIDVTYRPWSSGDHYAALTILDYTYTEPFVTGTLHNDSGYPLHAGRVVAFEPVNCGWREATLGVDTLMPGEETSFTVRYGASCGVDDRLVASGQGAFQTWILP